MKSEAYWRKRAEGILLEAERNTTDYLNQLNVLYRNTAEEIDRKSKKIFDTYRKDFTAEQAKQWLNEVVPRAEYDELKNSILSMTDERMKKQALLRLNAPAYRYRITRLQYLKQQIMAELSIAADREKQVTTQCYVDAVKFSYYHTMYELQQGVGLGFSFAQLPHSTIDRLLSARWYGRNYSASIWRNRGQVATAAANVIKVGVLAGQSIPDMSKALMEQTYTNSMRNATRLVRTEVNYFSNQGAIESYKEAGIEKYEFMATLDLRTSPMCREHDGKTYLIREATVGGNYPPLHPYCRSTVAAVVDVPGLERMDKRAARNPLIDKTTTVENMPYDKWKKTYVDIDDTLEVFQSMKPYYSSDGTFNMEAAINDYRNFLQTVPEECRIYLEQALNAVDYFETKLPNAPFGYSPSRDTIFYDPTKKSFMDLDFRIVNTHELSHRIDAVFIHSWENEEFQTSIMNAKKIIDMEPEKYIDYCNKYDKEGFLSDILDSICESDYRFPFSHGKDYWKKSGNSQKEIFANLFSLESFNDVNKLSFIKENFSHLYDSYRELLLFI